MEQILNPVVLDQMNYLIPAKSRQFCLEFDCLNVLNIVLPNVAFQNKLVWRERKKLLM